ncbi:SURF1 family protein [Marinovum sp.]|uniref:SURF1 family protein n=1 Tax=Marinovum sp. TaxID=2024839 RepID=UPI002B27BE75|nr:SURF1 family protein [Marinovum sp.]
MTRILFALIIGLAGTALLVWLGTWQVQRLAWKEDILAAIDARITAEPIALPEVPDIASDTYAPVALSGQIGSDALYVLVSQKHIGAGYRVIAPFLTNTGRRILIDRGFIPVSARDAARRTGAAEITGNIHWPDDRTSSTPENDQQANIWYARDVAAMARALKTEPLLVILRSETPPAPGLTPLPVDSSAIPNDHLKYAITWFSLAAIWLGMTGYYIFRARQTKDA